MIRFSHQIVFAVLFLLLNVSRIAAQHPSDHLQLDTLMQRTYQKMANAESLYARLNFAQKAYHSKDTSFQLDVFNAMLRSEAADDYMGGYYWYFDPIDTGFIDNEWVIAGFEVLYDLEYVYLDTRKENVTSIGAVPQSGCAHPFFLRPNLYKNIATQVEQYEIKNSQWNGQPCWHIQLHLENLSNIIDRHYELWIDTASYDILRIISTYQYDNYKGVQYNEWDFLELAYDSLSLADFHAKREALNEKRLKARYKRYRKMGEIVPTGERAPTFEGWDVAELRTVHSSEYLGQPILLCFWSYFHDDTEQDSIFAFLNSVVDDFDHQVMVVGLVFNNHRYNSEDVLALVNRKEANFNNLLIDFTVANDFGTVGFPEFYIINAEGLVQQTYIGYLDSYRDKMRQKLRALMK